MPQTPSLRQLRAFRHVMSLGSMSAAAQALHLTQPALSKQIAQLEERLQIRLFARRRGGPMVPTQEGIALFRSIEGTLYGLDAIPDIARGIAQQVRRQLRIAATPPIINCGAFTRALSSFRAKSPDVQVSLFSRSRVDLEDWVRSRQADLSLGLLPSRASDLTSVTFASRCCVAVMAPDHPMAGRPTITVRELTSGSLILPSRQPLRDRIDAALPGLSCDVETSSSISCVSLALSQKAIALCDPYSPTMYPDGAVRALPFDPRILLSYGALLPRGAETEHLIETLLSELKASFAALQD